MFCMDNNMNKKPHSARVRRGNACVHGGDIYGASRLTGIPVHKIIDFSASINPLGASPRALKAAAAAMDNQRIRNYPPPHADGLALRIAETLGAGVHKNGERQVITGNGSTELIYLLPRALRPKTVLIHNPTFSEYRRAALLSGARLLSANKNLSVKRGISSEKEFISLDCDVLFDFDRFARAMREADMAYICNPNNPTGELTGREVMAALAREAKKARCHLVVDEAFIDFCPGQSLAEQTVKGDKNPWLIILRSMTKFHALTGLRMGYAVFGSAQTAKKVLEYKEPWSVNIPAMEAALAALDDAGHAEKTLRMMEGEKNYIGRQLKEAGIWYLQASANFFLIRIKGSGELVKRLLQKGILVRDCSNFEGLGEGFIRIAIKKRGENRLLLNCIRDFLLK